MYYFKYRLSYGSGQRLATGWAVRDRIPVGPRFSAPVQTVPGTHPVSYTVGTRSFPRVKRPGHGVGHPPLSNAEVQGRVQLYICSPSGPSWPVLGWIYLYLLQVVIVKRNSYNLAYSLPSRVTCSDIQPLVLLWLLVEKYQIHVVPDAS
jgi:hypothetical protein